MTPNTGPADTLETLSPSTHRDQTTIAIARERYLVPFALLLLFGWLAFNGFTTIQRIIHSYTALPYWDYWRVAQNLSSYETFDIHAFWRQHNDHRIVFPEIVFAMDMLVLHGRMILPLAVSFVSYLLTWLLLSASLFADRQLSRSFVIAASLLSGVIALWEGSTAVLATPFQLQWTLVQLASVLSLFWLWKLKESAGKAYLVAVIAAAVVANYSSGNGLLLWPFLLTVGLVLNLPRRQWLALAIASLTSTGLYFVGFQFGSDLQLQNLVLHPFYLLGYIGSYLSMPFGGMKSPEFGVWVGLSNLFISIFFFFVAYRRALVVSRTGVLLFGSYGFTLLTILLTAAGRMDPADPAFDGAKPTRYITVPLMNWAVFILLSLWISARARFRFFTTPALTVAIALLLLLYLPKLRDWLALITEDFSEQQLGALSLENDVTDPNLLRKIFISPEFVVNYLPELHEQHLSIYYKSHDRWLGKPTGQFARRLDTSFPGELSRTYPVRGGTEVVGWADGSALRRPYTWVVLANERGEIIGFGKHLPAGFPSALRSDATPPSLAWVGFANLSTPSGLIFAYVVDPRRGGLYPITGSIPVPAVQPASLEETAGQISGLTWQKDVSWSENRLPPRVPFGQTPPGVKYGSWSGNDVYTGQLESSSFAKPAKSCVVLPVLHGPNTSGLSLDLIDAGTKQVIARAPMQDGITRWEYWRIPIPEAVRSLRIVARDAGKGWGEWIATADPLQCL